jgi:hypothetical protein
LTNLRSTIDEIKSRTDLRQILPDVRVTNGQGYCLCPFHVEDTPSCHVLQQWYYCFGCGATGDIIDWYESAPGGGFGKMEALRIAAIEADISLDEGLETQVHKMIEEREQRQDAVTFYQEKLADSEKAKQYLADRGLTEETIKHFGLGYRPNTDAISIPIYGKSGSLDSVSYRFLDPNNKQRYQHKNNSMWTKGDCLYNARALVFEDGPVYVCEGMFDAMSIWQLGFKRVVGIMGGTLNDHQVKEFGGSPVVFIPDQKKEGDYDLFKKSVFRLRNSHPDLVIRVAILPEGDANSVAPEILKGAIDAAEPAEFSILRADLETCGGDIDSEYKVARKIATDINDPLTKDDIVRWLASRWGKSPDIIRQAITRATDTPTTRVQTISDGISSLESREVSAAVEGVTTGTLGLGTCINRPHTSQMALIAARANVGKTMIALNLLHAARELAVPTLFVSMEQPTSELVFRLALMASADITPLNSMRLSEHVRNNTSEWQCIKYVLQGSYPNLRFVDKRLTPEGIRDAIIDASYSIGETVQICYIDYLGLMGHAMRSNDSYERMSAIARDIQAVTREMDVFGIYLMQLSRKGGDGSERVTLDMMRDSGVMEEVADYIIGAWRDKDRNQHAESNISQVYVNVCKNRHGPLGEAKLWMHLDTLLISPCDFGHDNHSGGQIATPPEYDENVYEMPVDPFDQ